MSRIISPASYVTVDLAAACIGLTDRAIRRKIQDGVWLDGREYRKGPDGRVYIHLPSVEKWVEQGQASKPEQRASAST